jgi:hypothetical protein
VGNTQTPLASTGAVRLSALTMHVSSSWPRAAVAARIAISTPAGAATTTRLPWRRRANSRFGAEATTHRWFGPAAMIGYLTVRPGAGGERLEAGPRSRPSLSIQA